MNIILTGLPLFAGRLCNELSSFDKKNKYYFYNTYYSRKDRFRFILRLPFAGRVVSLNGVSDRSGSLDWVLRFRKKLVMLWQGTDAMLARERFEKNTILLKYIRYASHFTDAVWLADELSAINIRAELLYFKSVVTTAHSEKFDEISAYSYVPKGKEIFYGLDKLLGAFKSIPDTKLFVYGTDGKGFDTIENVFYRGWMSTEDYKKTISDHALYIRLAQHDGYSLSVLEALGNGSEVIWNHPLDYCHFVKGETEELILAINEIKTIYLHRNYSRHHDGEVWVQQYLNPEKILRTFIDTITH